MNHQEQISVDALKAKADVLAASLAKNGLQLKRTQVLETVAQMYGYPNWSTARAAAAKRKPGPVVALAAPADGLQDFEVTVVRTGYGNKVMEIYAESVAEAHFTALKEAGDYDFSEHGSDYAIEGKEQPPEEEALTPEDYIKGPLAEYEVDVCRISIGSLTQTYRAKTREEAEEMALDDAGNHYYSEHNSRYVVNSAYKPSR